MFEHRSWDPFGRSASLSLVVLIAGTLGLAGCGIFESSDPFSELEVDSTVALNANGDTVVYSLRIRNPTTREVELTDDSGVGGVGFEVHAIPAEGGGLLWDVRRWPRNVGVPVSQRVPGGGTVTEFGPYRMPVSRILGDSIPPGWYEVRVRPNFEQSVPEDGLVPLELLLGGS